MTGRGIAVESDIKIGKVFGRLTVASRIGRIASRQGIFWRCDCSCGSTADVVTASLAKGATTSCGCYRSEATVKNKSVHGHRKNKKKSLTYVTYISMITRCLNKKAINYPRYGGSGVTICDRWLKGDGHLTGFECFLADMGDRPSKKHSIDRKESLIGYEPGNCRWATSRQQSLNRSITRMVKFRGEQTPLSVAAEMAGINYGTALSRIYRGRPWDLGSSH